MGGVKPTGRKQIMRKTLVSGIVAAGILTMPLAHADGNIDEFNQYLLQCRPSRNSAGVSVT